MSTWTAETVQAEVLKLVKDFTQDFDFGFGGEPGPDSYFVKDLDFKSTDVVELVVAVESRFGKRKMPFQDLVLKQGKYADFTVRDLGNFIYKQLNGAQA
jgi:acyl carrier protein